MKNLIEKSDKDLKNDLNEKRESLRAFRFGISGSKIRNVKEGRSIRKDIARILTVISARKKEQK